MCRISLAVNVEHEICQYMAELQENGGVLPPEYWRGTNVSFGLNRLDVTSGNASVGTYPLQNDRYVLCFNGEVFASSGHAYNELSEEQSQRWPSDVHFALEEIERLGIIDFFEQVDFQGAFLLHDKIERLTYLVVDQLNICGCFYALTNDGMIAASEHAVVHRALQKMAADDDTPINIVPNGRVLKIREDGTPHATHYRRQADELWTGKDYSRRNFLEQVLKFEERFVRAVRNRIPKSGDVAVMVSGGVDSSYLLKVVWEYLKERKEEERLQVFTYGLDELETQVEFNDLVVTKELMEELKIPMSTFSNITPQQICDQREHLFRTKVFCSHPRLIPADPVRTQCRHTVTMSCVLAYIVAKFPQISTVLTGDGADEIFAGYNSMCQDVENGAELRTRIHHKLVDFPLNDAGRVSLACYHGTKASQQASSSEIHPIEVRMPYTSHLVLDVLVDSSINYVTGFWKGEWHSKFLLRIAAIRADINESIAFRQKVPFNEGGSGVANSDQDSLERCVASEYLELNEAIRFAKKEWRTLIRLGIVSKSDKPSREYVEQNFDKIALVVAAMGGGLKRLLLGPTFRDVMPDSIYDSKKRGTHYYYYKHRKPLKFGEEKSVKSPGG